MLSPSSRRMSTPWLWCSGRWRLAATRWEVGMDHRHGTLVPDTPSKMMSCPLLQHNSRETKELICSESQLRSGRTQPFQNESQVWSVASPFLKYNYFSLDPSLLRYLYLWQEMNTSNIYKNYFCFSDQFHFSEKHLSFVSFCISRFFSEL